MTEEEARRIGRVLGLVGLPGEVASVDPAKPGGAWAVYEQQPGAGNVTAAGGGRREVTLPVLDALIEKLGGRAPRDCEDDEPGWHGGKPVRGFVVPPVEAVPPDEVSPPDERE